MGYETDLTGRISIDPPLNWARSQQHPLYVPEGQPAHSALKLLVVEEPVETVDGPLQRRRGVGLVFAWSRPVKCYDILKELQSSIDFVGAGHQHTGEMEATGSAFGDIWKLAVDEGEATRLIPTITWPDGTIEKNDRYRDERNGYRVPRIAQDPAQDPAGAEDGKGTQS